MPSRPSVAQDHAGTVRDLPPAALPSSGDLAPLASPFPISRARQAYPLHLVRSVTVSDGRVVTIRPIRPEDAAMEQEFVKSLSTQARYQRFLCDIRHLPPEIVDGYMKARDSGYVRGFGG